MTDDTYFPAIRQLVEYEIWCNRLSIEAAGKLSAEELFRRFPFGFKTVHHTLFHIVEVVQAWCGSVAPVISKPPEQAYDAKKPLAEIDTWNERLSDAFLTALDESHAKGMLQRDRRIAQAFHLAMHSTHHRTQFITMLRLMGKDPPFEAGDFGGWSSGR